MNIKEKMQRVILAEAEAIRAIHVTDQFEDLSLIHI